MHVINCLSVGGAERQLLRLATAQHTGGDEVRIVTLLDKDTLRPEADRAGVPVHPLGLHGVVALPRSLRGLRAAISDFQPEVVQSWLYWANLASLFALGMRASRRQCPLAWNIRQSLPSLATERATMRIAVRMGARWSPRVDALVYNAERARDDHRTLGYRNASEHVIPNAFDLEASPHGVHARTAARAVLAIPADAPAIVHAARLHPMKDHAGFLQAVAPLLTRSADLVVVLFGRDVTAKHFADSLARHPALAAAVDARRLRFEGERLDIPAVLPAFDLLVCSSAWGEAFSNTVAEAMVAGVPVVATDVGDARQIVGECGRIVPPCQPDALGTAIGEVLSLAPEARAALGHAGRSRMSERSSNASVLGAYRRMWHSLQ